MPPYLVMWVHLVAVIAWVGGQLFIPVVLRPALRQGGASPGTAEILRRVGRKFRTITWVAIITLIITGAANILNEGGSDRIASAWGAVLMLKLVLVAATVGLTLVHDFILDPYGPSSGRPQTTATLPSGTPAVWIEHAILILSFSILLVAAYLARM